MRLLNQETFKLEFFPDRPYPQYAILSHTWGPTGSEVTFRDMENRTASLKYLGFEKLKYTCAQAKADGIPYVWVDTCCIDKESSAELSESINSMFAWYQEAKVCYAFLNDVPNDEDPKTSDKFARSKWFTRGWTLQELIAPKQLIFYSRDWAELGQRKQLASTISNITKIDEGILTGMLALKNVSVAKRMSWASDRMTTRREDIAYCLMGLFDVNMAMLYGEGGEKAFRRLQEEIMKDSDDETLFAWVNTQDDQPELRGLLAKAPACFRGSSHYIPDYDRSNRVPYSIGSQGLSITMGLRLYEDDIWIGALECPVPPRYEESLAIYLKKLDRDGQQYARVKSDRLCKITHKGPRQTIYVRQDPLIPGFDDIYVHHVFQLRNASAQRTGSSSQSPIAERGYRVAGTAAHALSTTIESLPTAAPDWVPSDCKMTFEIPRGVTHVAGTLELQRPDGTSIIVMLGSKPGFGVAIDIVPLVEVADYASQKSKRLSLLTHDGTDHLLEDYFRCMESCFKPQPPGTWVHLDQERVRVTVQARKYSGIRYYMVDILIEVTPVVTLEDLQSLPVVGGIIAGLPVPRDDPSASKGADKEKRSWKHPFRATKS
ncbi:HET-domain-containing protein [Polyplosphaeria fusca]|uniref:HET-domain-containing protein n=1 Tax=Polyplosphaeria fusca TaxID=682080 RepID=A0A9P4R8P7_9PLEO|nr:HET-domain-containing protein [Polyplosphaeria fusca]